MVKLFKTSHLLYLITVLCSTPGTSRSKDSDQDESPNQRNQGEKSKLPADAESPQPKKKTVNSNERNSESDEDTEEGRLVIDENAQSPINPSTASNSAPTTSRPISEFLLSPNQIFKKDMCQYLIELTSRLLYFKSELSEFNSIFLSSFPLSKKRSSAARKKVDLICLSESSLIKFVNDLLQLNTLEKNRVNFTKEMEQITHLKEQIYLSNSAIGLSKQIFLSNENGESKNAKAEAATKEEEINLEKLKAKLNEMLNKVSFYSIYTQVNNLYDLDHSSHDKNLIFALISIFGSINRIVEFYNRSFRESLHVHLTSLDLSFIANNQKFIKYSKFESHPNYLAYLMVDLYFSLFGQNKEGKFGLFLNQLEENNLTYTLSILSLIAVLPPQASHKILESQIFFEKILKDKVKNSFILDRNATTPWTTAAYTAVFDKIEEIKQDAKRKNPSEVIYIELPKLEDVLWEQYLMIYNNSFCRIYEFYQNMRSLGY